jgi:predicted GNAT family acetyltransferase
MVEHDEGRQRFFSRLKEGEAYLSYEEDGEGTLDLQHTVVPEPARGRGVGESLVRAALDHAREQGVRIVPSCPFVAAYLAEHPEERELVAD